MIDVSTHRSSRSGMGSHESSRAITHDWITPKRIIDALGPFDLDPCSSLTQPWLCAETNYTIKDDGLYLPWSGRVWLNPPYGNHTELWLQRLANHGNGIALIFARTETKMFHRFVWPCADSLLFLRGRIHFAKPNGQAAKGNSGAPSVLVAYGQQNTESLRQSGIEGVLVQTEAKCASAIHPLRGDI